MGGHGVHPHNYRNHDCLPAGNKRSSINLSSLEHGEFESLRCIVLTENQPVPELDRMVVLFARDPSILRMKSPPEDCNAEDGRIRDTGTGCSPAVASFGPLFCTSLPTSISLTGTAVSSSSGTGIRIRTFLNGEDWSGEEEKESFRLRGGVRRPASSLTSGWLSIGFGDLVNAGPRRLTAGELRLLNAWRLDFTLPALEPLPSIERGVKNLLNERGVTVGGFLCLRRTPASEAMDGGEEGTSSEEGGITGSDLGNADRTWLLSIMH